MKITVFGSSSEELEQIYYSDAEKLAELLAEKGHEIVYGGGSRGLIGAFAGHFTENGGKASGIAPKFFDMPGMLNVNVNMIFTDTLAERITGMYESCDCIVALPGGVGTFEEIFCSLSAIMLGTISKPIILLNTNNYYSILNEIIKNASSEHFLSPYAAKVTHLAESPEELLRLLDDSKIFELSSRELSDYLK